MKPFITLLAFGAVLAGLLTGWVQACETVPREGVTTVAHVRAS